MSKGPNLPFYGFPATAKHVGNSTERQRQRVVMRVTIKSYREKCKTKEWQGRVGKREGEIHSARKRPPTSGSLYTYLISDHTHASEGAQEEGAHWRSEVIPFLLGALFRLLSTTGTRGSPARHRVSVRILNYSQRRIEGSAREKKKTPYQKRSPSQVKAVPQIGDLVTTQSSGADQ